MPSELARLHEHFGWSPNSVATQHHETGVWVAKNQEVGSTVYSDERWVEMDALLDKSWWYDTRNKIILDALRGSGVGSALWDIGGGSGVVAGFLNGNGYEVIGVEPSRGGAELASRRGVISFSADLADLELPSGALDAVSMFDVLEHVEQRDRILGEIRRVLKPGGYLILTLPALKLLWSQFDEDGGHFLRYGRRAIRKELGSNGFEIQRAGYFYFLTVLPLLLLRVIPYRLGRRQAVGNEATLSASGGILGRLASIIERKMSMRAPFGSSLLVIAQKR